MIRLTQYELAKIITRKSVYLALIGLLVLLALYACFGHPGPLNGTAYYKPYEGAITEEKVQAAQIRNKARGTVKKRIRLVMVYFMTFPYFRRNPSKTTPDMMIAGMSWSGR